MQSKNIVTTSAASVLEISASVVKAEIRSILFVYSPFVIIQPQIYADHH